VAGKVRRVPTRLRARQGDGGPEMTWAPVLLLTALAVGLPAIGLAGLRRRDLTA
jgi:putative exporter of polyketide antibiotics